MNEMETETEDLLVKEREALDGRREERSGEK